VIGLVDGAAHRDVPPDVTLGVEELDDGAELPELPVAPELPELPELPLVVEEPPEVVPAPVVPDPVEVSLCTLLAPGCSWATTIPMNTVAPVTARTATRVRSRMRAWTFSRPPGVFDWMWLDIAWEPLLWDAPWHHARLDTVAGPAVGLL
jgi:hypothetical protein